MNFARDPGVRPTSDDDEDNFSFAGRTIRAPLGYNNASIRRGMIQVSGGQYQPHYRRVFERPSFPVPIKGNEQYLIEPSAQTILINFPNDIRGILEQEPVVVDEHKMPTSEYAVLHSNHDKIGIICDSFEKDTDKKAVATMYLRKGTPLAVKRYLSTIIRNVVDGVADTLFEAHSDMIKYYHFFWENNHGRRNEDPLARLPSWAFHNVATQVTKGTVNVLYHLFATYLLPDPQGLNLIGRALHLYERNLTGENRDTIRRKVTTYDGWEQAIRELFSDHDPYLSRPLSNDYSFDKKSILADSFFHLAEYLIAQYVYCVQGKTNYPIYYSLPHYSSAAWEGWEYEVEATQRHMNMINIVRGGQVFAEDAVEDLSVFYDRHRLDGNYHHHFRDWEPFRPALLGEWRFDITPESRDRWNEVDAVRDRITEYYQTCGRSFKAGLYDISTIFMLAQVKDEIQDEDEIDEPHDYPPEMGRHWPFLEGQTCIRPGHWTTYPETIDDPVTVNAYMLDFIEAVTKDQPTTDTANSDEDEDDEGNDDQDDQDPDQDDDDNDQGDLVINEANPCASDPELKEGSLGAYTLPHYNPNGEY